MGNIHSLPSKKARTRTPFWYAEVAGQPHAANADHNRAKDSTSSLPTQGYGPMQSPTVNTDNNRAMDSFHPFPTPGYVPMQLPLHNPMQSPLQNPMQPPLQSPMQLPLQSPMHPSFPDYRFHYRQPPPMGLPPWPQYPPAGHPPMFYPMPF